MRSAKLLVVAVIIFLSWGCIPQAGPSSPEVKKRVQAHYDAGIAYLRSGKTPQALKELLEARSLDSSNADIEHALGLAYQQKGEFDKALAQYKKALRIDPKLTEARNNMGTVYLVKQEYDKAIEQFKKCIVDDTYPTPEKAYYNLGIAYFKENKIDKAIESYEKALRHRTDNVNVYFNLAFCYETKKRYPMALSYYGKAVNIEPSFKEALCRIGVLRLKLDQCREASQALERAVQIDPDFLEGQYWLGESLVKCRKVPAGLKKFMLVARADPDGPLGKKARERIKSINRDKFKGIPKVKMR